MHENADATELDPEQVFFLLSISPTDILEMTTGSGTLQAAFVRHTVGCQSNSGVIASGGKQKIKRNVIGHIHMFSKCYGMTKCLCF
jgi:hypothetical protein